MTDLLSIATFAADQIPCELDRIAGLDIHFVVGIHGPIVEIGLVYVEREDLMNVNTPTLSRTAQILAEMRADTAKRNADFSDRMYNRDRNFSRHGTIVPSPLRERSPLATGSGRSDALVTAEVLLKGTERWDMNNAKRDHSLPKRALSMASSRGRCTPDMLSSLMAFFSNPGDMAHTLLLSFLPTRVSTEQAKGLLSDPFVVDVIEGLGFTLPTPSEAVKGLKQGVRHGSGHGTGSARRVTAYTPGVAPTVDAKRRGRPSGVKQVAWLAPTQDVCEAAAYLLMGNRPVFGCTDLSGLPGGNDTMQGAGHAQGAGWAKTWAEGKALSPAQLQRRDAALDALHTEAKRIAAAASAE